MIKIMKSSDADIDCFYKKLRERSGVERKNVITAVEKIISDVKEKGDEAVIEYEKKFDCPYFSKGNIKVTEDEIKRAYSLVDADFIKALKHAKENITYFHEKQKRNSWIINKENGVILGQRIRPIETAGMYVPGGTAAYPSSVLMNAIPGKVAGVKKLIMVTPPSKDGSINPNILVSADIAGVDEIYKAGGAQAIAALAFGTESIPKVYKIVGPGNIYVATAKRCVYGYVSIDMIAGPSEILVIADESSNPEYIAADIMSQAEHDALASAILITDSMKLAENVQGEIEKQIKTLERKRIIRKSLEDYGGIIVTKDIDEAIDIANSIAPEHLELAVKEPFRKLGRVKNAGSIFLGMYSPEPLGDYMAGPNHVLPTNGTSRFFSPLSVDDFIKKSSITYYNREALSGLKEDIIKLAESEGLTAHANSIKVRFK